MDSLETIARFLGWCSVINAGILCVAALAIALGRDSISKIHGKIFGLDDAELARAYFQYLAQYKIAIFVFNIVPYFAVRILA